jgi:hypothetical protein
MLKNMSAFNLRRLFVMLLEKRNLTPAEETLAEYIVDENMSNVIRFPVERIANPNRTRVQ